MVNGIPAGGPIDWNAVANQMGLKNPYNAGNAQRRVAPQMTVPIDTYTPSTGEGSSGGGGVATAVGLTAAAAAIYYGVKKGKINKKSLSKAWQGVKGFFTGKNKKVISPDKVRKYTANKVAALNKEILSSGKKVDRFYTLDAKTGNILEVTDKKLVSKWLKAQNRVTNVAQPISGSVTEATPAKLQQMELNLLG